MTKVLIVYCVSTQTTLMKSIQKNVGCELISIDLLNIETWELYSLTGKEKPYGWYSRIVGLKTKNPLVYWFNKRIHLSFDKILFKKILSEYDVVDFHYFSSLYYPLLPLAKSMGKRIIITLWGSDLFRATNKEKEDQRRGYGFVDKVHVATPYMYEMVCSEFPEIKDKVVVFPFGNQSLDDFNNHYDDSVDESFLSNYANDKRMIVCGYNGSVGQRHLEIIKMLNSLPPEVQRKLYVVFPMTYGANPTYIHLINEELIKGNYSYDILVSRLTSRQLFDLRRLTDIVVNIQVTDAFSGSIQEHIFCKNVMLLGDWLPYDVMKNAGIFYLTTSLENLSSSFLDALDNYDDYKIRCSNNKELMYELTSWAGLSGKWKNLYISML